MEKNKKSKNDLEAIIKRSNKMIMNEHKEKLAQEESKGDVSQGSDLSKRLSILMDQEDDWRSEVLG